MPSAPCRRIALAAALGLSLCGRSAAALAQVPRCDARTAEGGKRTGADTPLDVFLVAGQSNATGLPDDAVGSPRTPPGLVLQFYHGRISQADDPVGAAAPGSAWPQFGDTYHLLTGHRVLFVPASAPASSLTRSGDFLGRGHWDSTGALFGQAVAQSDAALKVAGPAARFAGVLWDQGEAEALAIVHGFETREDYRRALQALIGSFRAHFGADTPVFLFETGASGDADQSGYAAVRAVQRAISDSDRRAPIVFKDAAGFPARGLMAANKVHYSQAGYNEMGRVGATGVAAYYGFGPAGSCPG